MDGVVNRIEREGDVGIGGDTEGPNIRVPIRSCGSPHQTDHWMHPHTFFDAATKVVEAAKVRGFKRSISSDSE